MASMPSEPDAVCGRLDASGRLVDADPRLEHLQQQAGSSLGGTLALPQLAAVAELARKLGIAVARPVLIASADTDIEVLARATPDGENILLSLEGWSARPAAAPRLSGALNGAPETVPTANAQAWSADEQLRLTALSPGLAHYLGVDPAEVADLSFTRVVRLEEDDSGEMPMLVALAARRNFAGQLARSRVDDTRQLVLNGDVTASPDGSFAGFSGTAEFEGSDVPAAEPARSAAFDLALEEALRSPLDRIIESADRIVDRSDGPLRNTYASYGADIAAAARHLLSVVESMRTQPGQQHALLNLAGLAREAVVMLETAAEEYNVEIAIDPQSALPANGDEHGVVQILVNLIGNALRHSPEGSTVHLRFESGPDTASVTVADQGPGIDLADQQRIFERFERDEASGNTGLGLAISRRLAQSMGGDVTLESTPGQGARFTLSLPTA